MQTGFCLIEHKEGFVVRRCSIYTTIPVDGWRRPTTSKEWCCHLTYCCVPTIQ